ncbi:MAG: helix-turn-helix domain-containing protein [Moorellaceae bacterium]
MSIFGQRLKSLRKEKGWTQEDLAAKLGLTRSAIAGYESPSKGYIPSPDILRKIAECFGVSVDYLLGHTDDRTPYAPVPETISLEDALQELLNSNHVMFNGLPIGELDEETKEDLKTAFLAIMEYKAKRREIRHPKKAVAAAGRNKIVNNAVFLLSAATF